MEVSDPLITTLAPALLAPGSAAALRVLLLAMVLAGGCVLLPWKKKG